MSWLLGLWRSTFGVPEIEVDPLFVTIWVGDQEVEVRRGPGFGRQIYQAAGRDALKGFMLIGPGAGFVGDCTPVDLKGGEVFVPVPYGG